MRLRHFETLRPVCPVCRQSTPTGFPLVVAHVSSERDGHIIEAILHCSNSQCQREYPVLDGVPLLLANIRQFIADNALRLLARDDLSESIESLIGDCCGPGSDYDTVRQQLSAYTWEHYSDFDPREAGDGPGPGTMLAALESGLDLAGAIPDGPVLEVGCGPGRGAFLLAERTGELVLGVDLHLPMLRLGSTILRGGPVKYPRRRVGLVYDRREFSVRPPAADHVDFWACDATALPFPAGTFALGVGLNVLDCIYAPREFLASLTAVLASNGRAVITTPYDWSPAATPLEAWLGGHSQRSPAGGSSETAVRSLLSSGAAPDSTSALKLAAERDDVLWEVRLHDRATMSYRLHLMVANRA